MISIDVKVKIKLKDKHEIELTQEEAKELLNQLKQALETTTNNSNFLNYPPGCRTIKHDESTWVNPFLAENNSSNL